MSTKGTILLAVGMLVLGLLLGMGTTMTAFSLAGRASFAPAARLALPGANLPQVQQFANGARVTSVEGNSPAEKAGLQRGDVITAVAGTKVDASNSLADLVSKRKPGEKVDLTVTRGSQTLTINVELGASSSDSSKAYLGVRYGFAPAFQRAPGRRGGLTDLPNG